MNTDYAFTLTGLTPLLVHADDVMASDDLGAWRKDPRNKGVSTPGDDRSPPWTWQTYLYHDGVNLSIPQECIMAALRYAGAKIPSKRQSTFKSMTQSGLLVTPEHCPLLCDGSPVAIADVKRFKDRPFTEHVKESEKLGFKLSVKRAKVGTSKHVRVRAMFEDWQVKGSISVNEPAITEDVLGQLFEIAGRLAGLCDWRPSSPSKPGPFGMFSADVRPAKSGRKAG